MIEKIKFKIKLSGSYDDKKPEYQIRINDALIASGAASVYGIEEEFEVELREDQYELRVSLTNKTEDDTLVENGVIVKDMLLNIDHVAIDGIDITPLLWKSRYTLDSPIEYPPGNVIESYERCVNLGHNGTWAFAFSIPLYDWLLETL
jgi:hypothetical protein